MGGSPCDEWLFRMFNACLNARTFTMDWRVAFFVGSTFLGNKRLTGLWKESSSNFTVGSGENVSQSSYRSGYGVN